MSETKKNKGGRPRVDATPITVRVPPDMIARLDQYIDKRQKYDGQVQSRPEAIRRILTLWLDQE